MESGARGDIHEDDDGTPVFVRDRSALRELDVDSTPVAGEDRVALGVDEVLSQIKSLLDNLAVFPLHGLLVTM
jgi:hypothetical protein